MCVSWCFLKRYRNGTWLGILARVMKPAGAVLPLFCRLSQFCLFVTVPYVTNCDPVYKNSIVDSLYPCWLISRCQLIWYETRSELSKRIQIRIRYCFLKKNFIKKLPVNNIINMEAERLVICLFNCLFQLHIFIN